MATEVAYYTYIYAKVDREHFQKVTSHARAAVLAGRASSGITGQLLISFEVLDYRQLHFISFAGIKTVAFSTYIFALNRWKLKCRSRMPLLNIFNVMSFDIFIIMCCEKKQLFIQIPLLEI